MRRDIQSRRRHFFNKRVSMVNYVAPETGPEEMLVDDSAMDTQIEFHVRGGRDEHDGAPAR